MEVQIKQKAGTIAGYLPSFAMARGSPFTKLPYDLSGAEVAFCFRAVDYRAHLRHRDGVTFVVLPADHRTPRAHPDREMEFSSMKGLLSELMPDINYDPAGRHYDDFYSELSIEGIPVREAFKSIDKDLKLIQRIAVRTLLYPTIAPSASAEGPERRRNYEGINTPRPPCFGLL